MMADVHDATPRKPRFDPTINLGHVLTVVSFVFGGIGAYYALKADIVSLDQRIAVTEKATDRMSTSIEKLTAVIVASARQDERLMAIERRVDAVERDHRVPTTSRPSSP